VAGLPGALAWPVALGLALEGLGLVAHARALVRRGGEAEAAHFEQRSAFGKTYLARNIAIGTCLAGAMALAGTTPDGPIGLALWVALALLALLTAIVGRALFYVLVIPTTMPGAFFWRNRAFEEHARETGLTKTTKTGIVHLNH
jgi:hypothetical protein